MYKGKTYIVKRYVLYKSTEEMKMLPETIGTAIVGALVAAAVILIIRKMIKDKKAGKNSCGCGCGSCPNAGFCHKK